MQNNSLQNNLNGFSSWAKFLAIMHFIFGGFSMFGIITIPIGIFYILSGIKLWEGAKSANDIMEKTEDTLVDENTLNLINSYKNYNKNLAIASIISIVLTVLLVIFYIFIFLAFFGFAMNSDMMNYGNDPIDSVEEIPSSFFEENQNENELDTLETQN
jgi:Family of unknown function (DUF5362)